MSIGYLAVKKVWISTAWFRTNFYKNKLPEHSVEIATVC